MSKSAVALKRRWRAQLGLPTITLLGIILPFAWAVFAPWVMVCIFSGLISVMWHRTDARPDRAYRLDAVPPTSSPPAAKQPANVQANLTQEQSPCV